MSSGVEGVVEHTARCSSERWLHSRRLREALTRSRSDMFCCGQGTRQSLRWRSRAFMSACTCANTEWWGPLFLPAYFLAGAFALAMDQTTPTLIILSSGRRGGLNVTRICVDGAKSTASAWANAGMQRVQPILLCDRRQKAVHPLPRVVRPEEQQRKIGGRNPAQFSSSRAASTQVSTRFASARPPSAAPSPPPIGLSIKPRLHRVVRESRQLFVRLEIDDRPLAVSLER